MKVKETAYLNMPGLIYSGIAAHFVLMCAFVSLFLGQEDLSVAAGLAIGSFLSYCIASHVTIWFYLYQVETPDDKILKFAVSMVSRALLLSLVNWVILLGLFKCVIFILRKLPDAQ